MAQHRGVDAIRERLRARGAAEHVVRGGAGYLISRWREFVDEIESRGCENCVLEEYFNDLDIRTLIHAAGLDAEVAAEDTKFRALLIHTDRRLWESDAPDPFWIYGYPQTARGQLLEDLRAAGFADS